MRINVVGTSGSGKSSFSQSLAEKLDVPYIELDALNWKPNWTESSDEELFTKLEDALSIDEWVLDGNYPRTQSIKWKRVQMVVHLDLLFHVVLYRIIKRSLIIRGLKGEELWAGNKETVWQHLFTRHSMILWTIKTFNTSRKQYKRQFAEDNKNSPIKFVRLCSSREVDDFIQNF